MTKLLTGIAIVGLLGRAEALDFAFAFGSGYEQGGIFGGVSGVRVDAAGNVYVADAGLNRIHTFTADGTFLTSWRAGLIPRDVALDAAGNVYVTDTAGCAVRKYTAKGDLVTVWPADSVCGKEDGRFENSPRGIAVDAAGNVYAVDSGNQRIQKFASDGTFLAKWGTLGTGDGQFRFVSDMTGIAFDSAGDLYVGDGGNCRIQKFAPDGTFLGAFGSCGTGDGQFAYPYGVFGIAIDPADTLYAVDLRNCRIQSFTTGGVYLSQFGSCGTGDGQFGKDGPRGIATNARGDLYVADIGNDRILVFSSGAPCALACPADETVTAGLGEAGAVVSYPAPTTSGRCGAVTAVPPSGSFFPVGASVVTASASGASCSFTVTVLTPQLATASIGDATAELVAAGALGAGQGNALTVKLEAAIASLDSGNAKAGCNQLRAFVNQVLDLVATGELPAEEGTALVAAAEAARASAGCR